MNAPSLSRNNKVTGMEMHQRDGRISVTRKNTYPVTQHSKETPYVGSGVSNDIPGTPEDLFRIPGGACRGMTLACSVYRTIKQARRTLQGVK